MLSLNARPETEVGPPSLPLSSSVMITGLGTSQSIRATSSTNSWLARSAGQAGRVARHSSGGWHRPELLHLGDLKAHIPQIPTAAHSKPGRMSIMSEYRECERRQYWTPRAARADERVRCKPLWGYWVAVEW